MKQYLVRAIAVLTDLFLMPAPAPPNLIQDCSAVTPDMSGSWRPEVSRKAYDDIGQIGWKGVPLVVGARAVQRRPVWCVVPRGIPLTFTNHAEVGSVSLFEGGGASGGSSCILGCINLNALR